MKLILMLGFFLFNFNPDSESKYAILSINLNLTPYQVHWVYSVLAQQLIEFVPQKRLFTFDTWLISYSRSRPIHIPFHGIQMAAIYIELPKLLGNNLSLR